MASFKVLGKPVESGSKYGDGGGGKKKKDTWMRDSLEKVSQDQKILTQLRFGTVVWPELINFHRHRG